MDEQTPQDPHDVEDPHDVAQVGQLIADRYEVLELLGAGGFAKVFRAFDRRIERDVAIKFLNLKGMRVSNKAMENILERFEREAKLAARIPHRNVVNIYDIGQVGADTYRPFIIMELLKGMDMDEFMSKHIAMRPERLLPLFVECLDALGQAHEAGIIHKDLKPSNLFLSEPNQRGETLRIVDFGIAHIKSGASEAGQGGEDEPGRGNRLTATGQILGTLQYLTPEYISSQIVTPALDVYQMGLILVELLCGEPLIKTDNAFECLRIHTFGLLELPEYLLESPLGPVLRVALAAEYEQRYANATEFADALSTVDASQIPASPLLEQRTFKTTPYLKSVVKPSPLASAAPGAITAEHVPHSTDQYQQVTGHAQASFSHASDATLTPEELERISKPELVSEPEPEPLNSDRADEPQQRAQGAALASLAPLDQELDLSSEPERLTVPAPAVEEPSFEPLEPPAPTDSRLKVVLVVVILAVIASTIVLGIILMGKTEPTTSPPLAAAEVVKGSPPAETPPQPPAIPTIPEQPPEPPATDEKPTEVVPPPVDAPEAAPPAKDEVKLVILEPKDAKISYKGASETGSMTYTFGKKERALSVLVEAEGYEPLKLKLKRGDGVIKRSLERRQTTSPLERVDVDKSLELLKAQQEAKKAQELQEKAAAEAAAEAKRLEETKRQAALEAERLRLEQAAQAREAEAEAARLQRLEQERLAKEKKPKLAD